MAEVTDGGAPFVIASGVAGLTAGRPATERDQADPASHPRVANAKATLDLAGRGVRSAVVRFTPTGTSPRRSAAASTLPVEQRPAEHFGWLGMFFGMDARASGELTRQRYGWTPVRAGLIADLDEGHYFGS
jgi:hypothetical protein